MKPDLVRAAPRPAGEQPSAFLEVMPTSGSAKGARPALGHTALLTPPDAPYLSHRLFQGGRVQRVWSRPHVRLIDLETEPMALCGAAGDDMLLLAHDLGRV
ncbi:MAG: hypothetical protein IPI35_21295 [Deltaproteobacteria bacterium]|nr:hypothetical protein [Deltaproteobacteria bacterium]